MRIVNLRKLRLNTRKVLAAISSIGPLLITRQERPIARMRALPVKRIDDSPPLWKRTRQAAQRAGYGKRDVARLIASTRAKGE